MPTTRPELLGTHGMVASSHWLASAAGMAMLEAGGNAADAAVAAGFVLQVVEPHLNGLGGEVPILVCRPGDQRPAVVCGQGPVPALATAGRVRDEMGLAAIPGSGLVAACVPGAFDAWMLLLRDWGTMPLERVLAPAVAYAGDGHPLLPRASAAISAVAGLFSEHWPSSAGVYLSRGRAPAAGSLFCNRELAGTYRRLVAAGAGSGRDAAVEAARDLFYRGEIAAAIDAFSRGEELLDGSGRPHRGLLRGEDLAGWSAGVEAPVTGTYRGNVVCKCGPWSQGPVLLQQLAMLEALGVERLEQGSLEWTHSVVEVAKLAFADREAWYGDSDLDAVPLDELLDPRYAAARARLVAGHASLELRPGSPGGRTPRLPAPGGAEERAPLLAGTGGEPAAGGGDAASGDTCHVDVVDRAGMMVSATPSGGWLQSSPVVPGLGFCLGTRAQMVWLEEGLPSSLRPGRRPRTTLSPTMVMREGRPAIAMGTPGGDQQDQWQLLVLLRHLDGGLGLQEAIEAPGFHTTHMPSSFHPRVGRPGELVIESRVPTHVVDGLLRRGHRVVVDAPWVLGRVSAVSRDGDGILHAAADPRGSQGYAVGR